MDLSAVQAQIVGIWRNFIWSKDRRRVRDKAVINVIYLDFWQCKSGLVCLHKTSHCHGDKSGCGLPVISQLAGTVNERFCPFPESDIEANVNVASLGQMVGFMKVINLT